MMKKNTVYRYLYLLIFILCILFLISCSEQEESQKSTNLVIIAGLHSNSQRIEVPIKNEIKKIYENFGEIGVIVVDGAPTIVQKEDGILGYYDNEFISESKKIKKNNKNYWQQNYLQNQIAALNSEIKQLQPDDPEVDTLAAFHEAVRAFNTISANNEELKEIIIFDTGLSTRGSLNFSPEGECHNLLYKDKKISEEDVKNLIESLDATADIPDLSKVKVSWYGLGNVAEPQNELSNLQIENLKIIWGEILKCARATPSDRTGADSEYGYFIPIISSNALCYEQPVSVVIDWDNIGTKSTSSEEISISAEELHFEKESDIITSEEEAKKVLLPYVSNLLNYPDMDILLVGTTADPNRDGGDIILSEARANAVKERFVKLGLNEEHISVLGWGAKEPLYDPSEWNNEQFIEDIAKKNRRVIILPYDSPLAQELLGE